MEKINITIQQIQLSFLVFLLLCTSSLRAQQGYSGNKVLDCDNYQGRTLPSPSYLYTCNGQNLSCQAFMIFKSQANYSSVSSISRLLSADSTELARMNNVSVSDSFPTNKEVIIPVNCSCSGRYYQVNTSYVISDIDTYFSLATEVYQGLSSCSALMNENPYDANDLFGGLDLLVPLRCACPSRNQTADGIKYLLTYPVSEGDGFSDLSNRFNASYNDTASANGFSKQGKPTIFPLTTILIPLPREPLSSQTLIHHPIKNSPSPFQPLHPFNNNNNIKRSYSKLLFSIAVAVPSLLVLCALVAVALWYHKKKMHRAGGKKKSILPKDILKAITDANHELKVFSCKELNAATHDFGSEYRIKGSVYRGVVRGKKVAVKEVTRDVSEEVNLLHKLNHFNLISLWGIGLGQEHCYLVYEYMENGSLKDWLLDRSRSELLGWNQRVQIALDIANGLDYLHNFAQPPYVHMEVKNSNVLLDSNLRAKIANFSMARSSEGRESGFAIPTSVEGTLGYMAPEYLEDGLATPKIDVYAFGVVMLELITGKEAAINHEGREKLLSSVMISIVEGRNAQVELSNFLDSTMRGGCPAGLALAMAKLSVACLRQNPDSRPCMGEAVSMLSRVQMESKKSGVA